MKGPVLAKQGSPLDLRPPPLFVHLLSVAPASVSPLFFAASSPVPRSVSPLPGPPMPDTVYGCTMSPVGSANVDFHRVLTFTGARLIILLRSNIVKRAVSSLRGKTVQQAMLPLPSIFCPKRLDFRPLSLSCSPPSLDHKDCSSSCEPHMQLCLSWTVPLPSLVDLPRADGEGVRSLPRKAAVVALCVFRRGS